MQKLKIFGRKVNIAFNLATQIAYEGIVDEPFDIHKLTYTKNSVALYMASIIANNPDTTITIEDLYQKLTSEEVHVLKKAVIEEMKKWLKIPDVIPDDQKKDDDGGDEKNA